MSELDMETLTNIIVEHEYGGAIYMSKATTEEDLRMTSISLVERRPSLSWRRGKKFRKSSKKGGAPEGSKRRSQSSSNHKWKIACREEVNPITAPHEALSPESQEVVAAFKGVVPYSRYSNDSRIP